MTKKITGTCRGKVSYNNLLYKENRNYFSILLKISCYNLRITYFDAFLKCG